MTDRGNARTGSDAPEPNRPIDGQTRLYRRINRPHYSPQADGSFRLRDTAFKNSPGGGKDMSVALEDTLADSGGEVMDVLAGYGAEWGLAAITTQTAWDHEQDVQRTPKDDDPAHGDVIGEKPTGRRKKLALAAEWVVLPSP